MKPKKIKKLALSKVTVARLDNGDMNTLKGGWNTQVRTCYSTDTSCVYTAACTCSCFDC